MRYNLPVTPGDEDIVMRTIWMEARGEPYEGKLAVAHVIINRAMAMRGRWNTLAQVCLDPYQFSGWRRADPNLLPALNLRPEDLRAQDCLRAFREAIASPHDPTFGAKHYFNPKLANPPWAIGEVPCYTCGNHVFYNTVR